MFQIWLLYFAFLGSYNATASEGYDTETNEGFKDFRGMGLLQPNNLFDGPRTLKLYCCKRYQLFGFKRTDENLIDITDIRNVDFSYNDIKTVNKNSFVGWENVTRLRLDYNDMVEITENAFSTLCLSLLSLKGNRLTNVYFILPFDEIPDLIIDLSYNYLRELQLSSSSPIYKLDCSNNLFSDTNTVKQFNSENLHLEDNKIIHFPLETLWTWREKSNMFLDRNAIQRLDGHVSEMNLNKLSISYNLIYYLSGSFFDDARSMTFINLSHNRITDLVDGTFEQLINLRTLDLSENNIVRINLFAFKEMPSLRKFSIGGNQISVIPVDFLHGSIQLQSMEVSGAAPLPNYFYSFPKLETLIWHNADSASLNYICAVVPKLRNFQLHKSSLPNAVEACNKCNASKAQTILLNQIGLREIPSKMIKTSLHLEDLSLAKNFLSSLDLMDIPSSVVKLNLSNNRIFHVRRSFGHILRSLRILDLEYNLLSIVPSFIFNEGTNLDFLNLRYNKFLHTFDHFQPLTQYLKTQYLCYHDKCVYLKAQLMNYSRDSGIPVMNMLGCECHESIMNYEGFSKRHILANASNFAPDIFKHNVIGCIKHVSISNGGNNLGVLHIFGSLASKMSSLSLSGWTLSVVRQFNLPCSPQLQRLSIIRSGITYINQSAFLSLPHLQYLDLSYNKMTKFEFESLQYIPKVKELKLSKNLLTDIIIPQNTSGILQLENLDLSYNALTNVDFGQYVIFSRLKIIYLLNNQIYTVLFECRPFDILNLCANFGIKAILLANNRIIKWAPLRNSIMKNVAELDLSSNYLSSYDGNYYDLICYLNLKGNNVVTFEQRGCLKGGFILNISDSTIVKLSNVKLMYNPKVLNVSRNSISEISNEDLADKLTLTVLDISHNSIYMLQDGCFSEMTELKILDLGYNQLVLFDGINVLGNKESNWIILEELVLRGNRRLYYIAMAVDSNSMQTKLTVSHLCMLVTNNCPTSGASISEYLMTPKIERTYLNRPNMPADIEFDRASCSFDMGPLIQVINLTCIKV